MPKREAKSIGHEETFSEDITDLTVIMRELLDLASRVGERLRRHERQGRTITIAEPTNDTIELFKRSSKLLKKTEAGKNLCDW